MKAMSGFDIFEKMTNVNDKFIDEAAEMPSPELAVVKMSRWERFSHFMNSGLGVAMICGIVTIGVMTGIIAAGRAGGPARPPAGTQDDPHNHPPTTESYEVMTEASTKELYGEIIVGNFKFEYGGMTEADAIQSPGGFFDVSAAVINLGEPFTYTGSSGDFLPTVVFRHQASDDLIHTFPALPDDYGTFTVATGEIGKSHYVVTIPENATVGLYDLVLSYGGESCTFSEVLQVTEASSDTTHTEANPPLPTKINSEEEAIEAAKLYLQDPNLNLTLPLPLEALEASAHHWQDRDEDEYWVSFRYYLCGIRTDYDIRITVTADGRFEEFKEASWHENSYWLVYTEEDVEDALMRIEGGDEFYFSYRDGKLYLCSEAIVSYPSKIPGQSGCGIDHDHVFYEEEVIHTEN